ncbi:MAG: cupin domain-containing protein [Acidimicrobiia bacterium]|nr:cupin domain-containing protein [Acidimicrobiia bacterium]
MSATPASRARARELIARLVLEPHPEGGYYRQLYKSSSSVRTHDGRGSRAALTTIYFLLEAGQHSRWHRVRSDEVWHFYEGDPLELSIMTPECTEISTLVIGGTGATSRVHVVPAGWWQAARPTGAYALVGCTVAPGFKFADFDFLPTVEPIQRLRPDLITLA